jgi:hypothetical protein
MSNPHEEEFDAGSRDRSEAESGGGGAALGSVRGSKPGSGAGAPLAAQSQQLEAAALRGLREADLSHEDVQMFNPLSDQDAGTKFKRNQGEALEPDTDQSQERRGKRVGQQVEELEAARAKQGKVANLAGKVVKKATKKAEGARRKTPSRSPDARSKSPASKNAPGGGIKKMMKAGLAQRAGGEVSAAQKLALKKSLNDLGTDFAQNLARIYNKGAHKSGVQACHKLIDDNSDSPEVVGVFLLALSDKNLLQVAKAASAGSFQFL